VTDQQETDHLNGRVSADLIINSVVPIVPTCAGVSKPVSRVTELYRFVLLSDDIVRVPKSPSCREINTSIFWEKEMHFYTQFKTPYWRTIRWSVCNGDVCCSDSFPLAVKLLQTS
jgi:hypothetical protein